MTKKVQTINNFVLTFVLVSLSTVPLVISKALLLFLLYPLKLKLLLQDCLLATLLDEVEQERKLKFLNICYQIRT